MGTAEEWISELEIQMEKLERRKKEQRNMNVDLSEMKDKRCANIQVTKEVQNRKKLKIEGP